MLVKPFSWLVVTVIGKGKVNTAYVTYSYECRGLRTVTLILTTIAVF